jgi:hypothetical protein
MSMDIPGVQRGFHLLKKPESIMKSLIRKWQEFILVFIVFKSKKTFLDIPETPVE